MSTARQSATSTRLDGLDGLRGVAALCVAAMHALTGLLPVHRGYLAVDFFFVLSGFVIARAYEPRFAAGLGARAYMVQRIERLYPLLALGGGLGVAAWLAGYRVFALAAPGDLRAALVSQITLVPFLSSANSFAFNAALWSVSFELVANGAHALAGRRLTNRWLLAGIGAAWLALALFDVHYGSLNIGWNRASLPGGFARVLFGFFLGVALCRSEPRWQPHMPCVPFWLLAALLVALVNFPHDPRDGSTIGWIYDLAAVTLALPLLVMLGVAMPPPGRLAVALGVLSFPIYVIHLPLLDALRLAGVDPAWRLAALLPIAALAWALGKYVDEPLNKWRRASRPSSPSARSATAPSSAAAAR